MHWEQPVTAMTWYRRRCWNDAGLKEDEWVSVSQMDKSRFAGSPDLWETTHDLMCLYKSTEPEEERERDVCVPCQALPHIYICKTLF